jgi:hypothetical protein
VPARSDDLEIENGSYFDLNRRMILLSDLLIRIETITTARAWVASKSSMTPKRA